MKPKKNLLLIVLVFAIALSKNANSQISFSSSEWSDWSEKDLRSAGYSIDTLSKAWNHIKKNTPATGMQVAIDGKVAIYFGDISETSYVASVRKSILAMIYGKYVIEGVINLDMTLNELEIDDIKGLTKQEKQATIKDILTSKSGIYHPASNTGDDTKHAPKRGSKQPGEYFLYNNWDFNVAGAVFEKLTNKNIYEAFLEDIAIPLGLQDFTLEDQKKSGDREKSKYLAYHFYLSTRDMCRLGQLMLNKGQWNGTQVIPEEWVNKISSIVTPNNQLNPEFRSRSPFGYGYMWWVWDNDKAPKGFKNAYSAQGNFGQYIVVLPELNMVIALKTKRVYQRSTSPKEFYTFLKLLVKSKTNL